MMFFLSGLLLPLFRTFPLIDTIPLLIYSHLLLGNISALYPLVRSGEQTCHRLFIFVLAKKTVPSLVLNNLHPGYFSCTFS